MTRNNKNYTNEENLVDNFVVDNEEDYVVNSEEDFVVNSKKNLA